MLAIKTIKLSGDRSKVILNWIYDKDYRWGNES